MASDSVNTSMNSSKRISSERGEGNSTAIRSAILIQRWYRRYRARLEARRRCTWMVYQSLEYAGEETQMKLYDLFKDLISLTHSQTEQPSIEVADQPLEGYNEDAIWNNNWKVEVPVDYRGPTLTFPIDIQQVTDLLEAFNSSKRIHSSYVFQLLKEAKNHLATRPNIQSASTSISKHITIVGDLHGQFPDLKTILFKNGLPDVTNPYVFNGDFVDRGKHSTEVIVVLLALMLARPTAVYGFMKEITRKYKSAAGALIKCFSDLFRYLPLATIIDEKVLVCHGGISDDTDLDLLKKLNRTAFLTLVRPLRIGLVDCQTEMQCQDILWSDPSTNLGIEENSRRGVGCLFGPDVSENLLKKYSLRLLIRSHECKPEGFEWTHDNRVLTLFSASNYYSDGSNRGAYAKLSSDGDVQTVRFVGGGKKQKSLVQSVNSAEQSAVKELRRRIMIQSAELMNEFKLADTENSGSIPLRKWCEIMTRVLHLKLPWRSLQPHLVSMAEAPKFVRYETTFQKLTVSNKSFKIPPSISEELYKNRDTLEAVFRAIDKDNSGRLTLNEFKEACLRLPLYKRLDGEAMEEMVRSMDFNKDGLIDFNEFLEAFRLAEDNQQNNE
ncbi:unnamed protein product [Calicophoron daubneyi]|uniref:protein-serine/threonine phosphatase n=1 Tax=Calicophoron daubneyi TaxID=300641 RepID=A0AAV2SZD9_CALDB